MQSEFSGTAPFDTPVNWSSRGYVPHYDATGKYQIVTYRLADSLPQKVLERLELMAALPALAAIPNPIWQREYWDRFIRDEIHFNKAIDYIHNNPRKTIRKKQ